MKRIALFASLGILAALHCVQGGASPIEAASDAVVVLSPAAMQTSSGAAVGALASMRTKDQSGAQNDPAKYVKLATPGAAAYRGFRTYILPASIKISALVLFSVRVNYSGPLPAAQNWSWWLYSWAQKKYVRVGDNGRVTSAAWTILSFGTLTPAECVGPSRQIYLQTVSGNASGDAKIDYEAISVRYSTYASGPVIAGCPMFPADNIWNARVDSLPVHSRSAAWIASIGRTTGFHMDFGSGTWAGGPIGIPYNIVPGGQPKKRVSFYYPNESDPGPYPIPASPRREWGSDHHILIVDWDNARLYEIYDASRTAGGSWNAGSGAIWNLRSNALRPAGWTSADAAGLPILPGLVRYEEAASGEIRHALRFTASNTAGYIWPARHLTSSPSSNIPPMGARFRLRGNFPVQNYPPLMQVILRAMQRYGIMLADNGADWYVSGAPDERWSNDMLHLLDNMRGQDFVAVDASVLMVDPNSGQARRR